MFPIPIALIVFRRPDVTQKLVDVIAAMRPQTLFVVADGPRADRADDAALCAETRAIIDRVPWPGTVHRNYSDVNLGCGRRPASGIDWVFEHVDRAIILEDDCIPHPSFFRFCAEMLERYRDDERIMHVAGTTYRREPLPIDDSYTFTQMCACWGWATWRRAWRLFDATVSLWPELRDTPWLGEVLPEKRVERFWAASFDRAFDEKGAVSYWDHQWAFACWAHSGLAVVPRVNLVCNIGCNADATHCAREDDSLATIPAREIAFPLRHPATVLHHRAMDREFVIGTVAPRLFPPKPGLAERLNRKARNLARRALRPLRRKSATIVPAAGSA